MRFEFIDKYYAERDKVLKIHQKYIEREEEARKGLEELKAQYENVLSESVKTGVDADDKLDELDQKIEEAEKLYARRQRERQEIMKKSASITRDDVIREWREKFRPAYKEQVMEPIYRKLMNIKREYYKAEMEYRDAVKKYEDEKREVIAALGNQRGLEHRLGTITPDYKHETERIFITSEDLWYLDRGRIAPSFKTYMEEDE